MENEMSFAIGWLKKENYPFEKYHLSEHKNELIMYFNDVGKEIYKMDFILIKLAIFDIDKYNSIDDLVYFKAIEAYKKLEGNSDENV